MAKIDIITLSAITASDGSIVASGATVKFNSMFSAASTDIKIEPLVYRNREIFELGFWNIRIPQEIIPYDFTLTVPEEEFYSITPTILYQKVCEYLNELHGGEIFEVIIITE